MKDNRSNCNVIPEIKEVIFSWAKDKGLDAAIWADLPSNFKEKTGLDFNEENAIRYLKSLSGEKLYEARQYIEKVPVDTPLKRKIKEVLGW